MDRRNFLRGTFGGVMAGGILLNLDGKPEDAAATLVKDEPMVTLPEEVAVAPHGEFIHPGAVVFDFLGKPIGVITEMAIDHDAMDITGVHDANRRFLAGATRVHARVLTSGYTTFDFKTGKLVLRKDRD